MNAKARIAWWAAAAAFLSALLISDLAHWARPVYAPIEHAWAFGLKVPGALVSMHLFGKIFWGAFGGAAGYLAGLAGGRALSNEVAAVRLEKCLAWAALAVFVAAVAVYIVENLHATPVPLALPGPPLAG
ncbi:MAG: hypothetical protein IT350_05745 [Deltaproteobacteria bacterium]|nr:hypothetical protein [Deltaproteobacteria bacterium]